MIHSATQTAKFTKLVRRLRGMLPGLPVDAATVAVGLLERLWHFTITSAKRGDIGQHDDELIAEACGWLGDPPALVGLLIETGWLDECPEHRLLVHDWPDHAPAFLRKNIDRVGGFLTRASMQPHNGSDEQGCERISAHVSTSTAQMSPDARTPNITKQNITKGTTPNGVVCSETPEASPPPASPPSKWVFPVDASMSHKHTEWALPQDKLDEYQQVYGSHLVVEDELRKARLWLESNPMKRKTARGMLAFLTKWLNRTANRSGGGSSPTRQKASAPGVWQNLEEVPRGF